MSGLIDAEALEKDGWMMHRTVQVDSNTMSYQTKKPTDFPTIEPEPHYDEWCTDCKEYDHERHCCPRWNKVIRETLKDAQPEHPIEPERKTGKWIKISPAGIYECSECGKNVMTSDIEAYEWCHGCGIKMEEGGWE